MRLTLPIMSMVITSYIPAEKISRAVEHPCQFWIGIRPFRLSVFGRRQQSEPTELSTLVIRFLSHHGLQDFKLTFRPVGRKKTRAKRGDTMINRVRPIAGRVQTGQTLEQLFRLKLYEIAPEIRGWIDSNQYRAVLTDNDDSEMPLSKTISELQGHHEASFQKALDRSRRDIEKVLRDCDRRLQPTEVDKLVRDILKERKGK
jgi:hypothetical protein